ncbi:hypothetical protein AAFF_G00150830 [Aldrovandia affinis]|uniref:ATP synthase F(1) complex subunit delta, mitochondrial n=1 Tax=Aldrovandia affinis TaxID=143900 RepID=A0AAD7RP99_9TELE|nr:hypothetical protein AAFF_G00150830 [Aldrovandia affinis]
MNGREDRGAGERRTALPPSRTSKSPRTTCLRPSLTRGKRARALVERGRGDGCGGSPHALTRSRVLKPPALRIPPFHATRGANGFSRRHLQNRHGDTHHRCSEAAGQQREEEEGERRRWREEEEERGERRRRRRRRGGERREGGGEKSVQAAFSNVHIGFGLRQQLCSGWSDHSGPHTPDPTAVRLQHPASPRLSLPAITARPCTCLPARPPPRLLTAALSSAHGLALASAEKLPPAAGGRKPITLCRAVSPQSLKWIFSDNLKARHYADAPGVASPQMSFTFASPTQVFFNAASVKQIDVPTLTGAFGILPAHVPTLQVLRPGVVTVFGDDGSPTKYFVSSGSVTVNADSSVQLLAEEAFPLDSLDLSAAKANLEKAQAEMLGTADEAARAEVQIKIEANEAIRAHRGPAVAMERDGAFFPRPRCGASQFRASCLMFRVSTYMKFQGNPFGEEEGQQHRPVSTGSSPQWKNLSVLLNEGGRKERPSPGSTTESRRPQSELAGDSEMTERAACGSPAAWASLSVGKFRCQRGHLRHARQRCTTSLRPAPMPFACLQPCQPSHAGRWPWSAGVDWNSARAARDRGRVSCVRVCVARFRSTLVPLQGRNPSLPWSSAPIGGGIWLSAPAGGESPEHGWENSREAWFSVSCQILRLGWDASLQIEAGHFGESCKATAALPPSWLAEITDFVARAPESRSVDWRFQCVKYPPPPRPPAADNVFWGAGGGLWHPSERGVTFQSGELAGGGRGGDGGSDIFRALAGHIALRVVRGPERSGAAVFVPDRQTDDVADSNLPGGLAKITAVYSFIMPAVSRVPKTAPNNEKPCVKGHAVGKENRRDWNLGVGRGQSSPADLSERARVWSIRSGSRHTPAPYRRDTGSSLSGEAATGLPLACTQTVKSWSRSAVDQGWARRGRVTVSGAVIGCPPRGEGSQHELAARTQSFRRVHRIHAGQTLSVYFCALAGVISPTVIFRGRRGQANCRRHRPGPIDPTLSAGRALNGGVTGAQPLQLPPPPPTRGLEEQILHSAVMRPIRHAHTPGSVNTAGRAFAWPLMPWTQTRVQRTCSAAFMGGGTRRSLVPQHLASAPSRCSPPKATLSSQIKSLIVTIRRKQTSKTDSDLPVYRTRCGLTTGPISATLPASLAHRFPMT